MTSFVGEIRSFAFGSDGAIEGNNAYRKLLRQGWLECDGRSLIKNKFIELFEAIGYNWGSEDKPNSFKIPDLRGLFLRGWDHKANRDVDVLSRTGPHAVDAPNDYAGATGDLVGSSQDDAFERHSHSYMQARRYRTAPGDHWRAKHDGPTVSTSSDGGNETRPKNVYVMYCIFTGVVSLSEEDADLET